MSGTRSNTIKKDHAEDMLATILLGGYSSNGFRTPRKSVKNSETDLNFLRKHKSEDRKSSSKVV